MQINKDLDLHGLTAWFYMKFSPALVTFMQYMLLIQFNTIYTPEKDWTYYKNISACYMLVHPDQLLIISSRLFMMIPLKKNPSVTCIRFGYHDLQLHTKANKLYYLRCEFLVPFLIIHDG